ncbi:DNA internalization-related competence protein ComEC/Rec2 [Aestuariirhabdus sp. Z084]|uniref:DNA internalization-related competence protein ComEC/Rec2 n=1 Tax=Aestuariirhabdus haliotis TaxID=2918751 RepID=UPI00201B3728|nr:DNA internalization-related competence protein ComEC/Rec2 [Aestuariirhabdus haliotis]MCL6414779.1 DNA internalization-related competence protein ComEC/Rec2 [Aestuariirhabdus haliotis]MCL6418711.1 DNA internalization-related competence protein ComEC/Rec2 [Aestuariirhabdus haliotis]
MSSLLWSDLLQGGSFLLSAALLTLFILLFVSARSWLAGLSIFFTLGVLYAFAWGHWALSHQLQEQYQGSILALEADVDRAKGQDSEMMFLVVSNIALKDLSGRPIPHDLRRVKLSWRHPTGSPIPGERWRMNVVLKPARGYASHGAFDYKASLLRKQIDSVGYIHSKARVKRIQQAQGMSLTDLRWQLGQKIPAFVPSTYTATARALLLGDSTEFSHHEWNTLKASGTVHLMVVSGLHITLFAGIGFYLLSLFVRYSGLGERVPCYPLAAIVALVLAIAYTALTGFQLPAQRALVMLSLPMVCLLLGISVRGGTIFLAALCLVLLWDPIAPVSAGFWYSFLSVAALILLFIHRVNNRGAISRALQAQGAVFLIVLLLGTLWAGEWNPFTPVVNLLAIPLVGMVVVPMLMAFLLLSILVPGLAPLLDQLVDLVMSVLWWLINSGAELSSETNMPGLPVSLMLLGAIVVFLWLLPATLQVRSASVLLLVLAWIGYSHQRPPLRIDILDVGQGLAIVVQTPNHVLLYDTGGASSSTFSAGNAVVLPFMRDQAINTVDLMMISHENLDHRGGAEHVIQGTQVNQISAGGDYQGLGLPVITQPCLKGQQWQWDSARFRVLWGSEGGRVGNDGSCVLLIETLDSRILLTGDIGEMVEHSLVADPYLLSAPEADGRLHLLQVPHHGSASSSSWPFIKSQQPRYAVFSAGLNNRFGHPDRRIVERYKAVGAQLLNTATSGTITFVETPETGLILQSEYRLAKRHYWW